MHRNNKLSSSQSLQRQIYASMRSHVIAYQPLDVNLFLDVTISCSWVQNISSRTVNVMKNYLEILKLMVLVYYWHRVSPMTWILG